MKRFLVQAPLATLAGKMSALAQFDTPAEAHAFARVRESNGHANTQIVDTDAKQVFTVATFAEKHRLRQ